VKMRGVDGGCDAECQRNESDQDARHPTETSSRAMTWHGGEAIPFLSAPQIAAFLEGFRVPGRRMTAVGFWLCCPSATLPELLNSTDRPYHSPHGVRTFCGGVVRTAQQDGSVSQGLFTDQRALALPSPSAVWAALADGVRS
jgi:hypothetical protein